MQVKQTALEKHTIHLPMSLSLSNALRFQKKLLSIPFAKSITFDCTRLNYVEPFSMLLTAQAIRDFNLSRMGADFLVRGNGINSYASLMGFFAQAGLSAPIKSTKRGNPRYLAVKEVDCDALKSSAYENFMYTCDLVEEDAEKMAAVLSQMNDGEIFYILKYTIQEMVRNVIEHSESKSFLYCGQYWLRADRIEIGFVGFGIGLRSSLEKNPKISNIDEVKALNLALTPGVSSTSYGPGGPKGKWSNTGFGPYMTSRLCCEGGIFVLLGIFGIQKNAFRSDLIEAGINRTGVRIVLKPSNFKSIQSSFNKYLEDAKSISDKFDAASVGMSPSTILKRSK